MIFDFFCFHLNDLKKCILIKEKKSFPYKSLYWFNTKVAVAWWKGVSASFSNIPKGFVDLMIALHNACESSPAIERVFSSFGLIHTKTRDKFRLDKATKN